MKKHIILFICVALFSTLLYGCSSNAKEITQYNTPLYSITVKDGRYNLTPKTPLSNVNASIGSSYPKFHSLDEMRESIISGSFTEHELYTLSRASQSADGRIEICDLDNLYKCTAPAEFSLKNITWRGKSYDFHFSSEKVWGGVYCYNKEEYTEKYNEGYQDFLLNPNVTLIKQEEIKERSATVYYCNTSRAELKYICYEIGVGDKKMFIQEEYLLKIRDNTEKVSSDIPSTIYFWGTENGGYFYGIFFDFTERPSVEWLCEFGITPYSTVD